MKTTVLAAACFLLTPALAVWTDEAWNVDYHYPLLGQPREQTTFFHQPNPASKANLIYSLSERGVLGAINPRDGSVVWRHLLGSDLTNSNSSSLRAGEGQDVVISGIGNAIAAWRAADGRQVWESKTEGRVEDVEILELSDSAVTPGVKDAIVITREPNPTVQRLDGASGIIKWKHKLDNTDIPYQVSASATEVYAILLHKTILGYVKIRVVALDPVTGHKMDEYTLNTENELSSAHTILSVGANSASPIIAWTDAAYSVLKVNIIGSKQVATFNIEKRDDQPVQGVRLHAPYHVNSLAHFLVHYETATSHWAEVFHIDVRKGKIDRAYSLPKLSGRGAFSTTTSDANVYFTRISEEEITTVSSVSHGVLGKWPLQTFSVAANKASAMHPLHAVAEVSVKGDSVSAIRVAVSVSTGDWILLRDGLPLWQRPEQLASTVSATFASSSEVEAFAQDLEIEAQSNPIAAYAHRLQRHIQDLQRLPELLTSLPQRFLAGFLRTTADGGASSDTFGFHQVIACATEEGRLVALDAGSPDKILWNEQVAELKPGEKWNASVTSPREGLIRVTEQNRGTLHFNASTGSRLVETQSSSDDDLRDIDAVKYALRDGSLEASTTSGPTWKFAPADGEKILDLVPRPVNDPVASIGKVLGDRRVLYKYLSPNSALLVTVNDKKRSATFYVLDTVSGSIIYSNSHTGVDLTSPIASIMSENWFAYSYIGESSEDSPKGSMLVIGEMFESLVPNDRGPLSALSNFSSVHNNVEPFTLAQTYQIPEAISKLAVTRTRQGITSRQLLAVLSDSHAIVGIPYPALDPRRPVNREPTKDEQSEGLARYSPVIEFDPKWYLNHQRELLGVTSIITSPALIESTSLVFAYGLDVFGTRLSPSFSFDILGKNFNKFQMLATVAALAVATFVVAPLVTRKQINARWQFA